MTLEARFWPKLERRGPDECWPWTGAKAAGYGQISNGGRLLRAHRLAYEWLVGPIPAGMQLDHLCRNRGCVNPAHLEPVTNRENVLRGVDARVSVARCPQGHDFTPDNTYTHPRHEGRAWKGRTCRTCARARRAARREDPSHD